MKKAIIGGILLFLAFAIMSCSFINGSGVLITEDRTPANGFTEIDCIGIFTLNITQSDEYSVSLTCDDNITEYVFITDSNDKLSIRFNSGDISVNNYSCTVDIQMPLLEKLTIGGVIDSKIDSMELGQLELNTDGVYNLDIENSTLSGDLKINSSGTYDIDSKDSTLTGNLDLTTEGTYDINLYGLKSDGNATLNIDGTGDIYIDVSGTIYGSLDGVCKLFYKTGTLDSGFSVKDYTCSVKKE